MTKALCLLLACLLLGGCSAQPAPEDSPAATVQTVPAEEAPMSLYVPDHPLEQSAPGALRVYPLRQQAHGIRAMGGNLIALCGALKPGDKMVLGVRTMFNDALEIHTRR